MRRYERIRLTFAGFALGVSVTLFAVRPGLLAGVAVVLVSLSVAEMFPLAARRLTEGTINDGTKP